MPSWAIGFVARRIGVIIVCVKKGTTRLLSLTGVALIGLSIVLYVALELSSVLGQAKTPGEKDMGLAVLFMFLGIPMLIFAALGLFCLIASALAFAYRRLRPRISS